MKHERLIRRYGATVKANRELRAENTKLRNELREAIRKNLDLEIENKYLRKVGK